MQIVIKQRRLNGLSYFELYVRDVYMGLYVTREDARAAAGRLDWSDDEVAA
jgi:hypothetical protein